MTDELNPQDTQPKKEKKPFIPWESSERIRPEWQLQKHGERVLPQVLQKSNQTLTDDQVMQSRTQPIATGSNATPIDGRHDTGHGQSDEPSGAKRTYPTSGGIAL